MKKKLTTIFRRKLKIQYKCRSVKKQYFDGAWFSAGNGENGGEEEENLCWREGGRKRIFILKKTSRPNDHFGLEAKKKTSRPNGHFGME